MSPADDRPAHVLNDAEGHLIYKIGDILRDCELSLLSVMNN